MKRTRPKQPPTHPDNRPMTDEDFKALHDQLADYDKVDWIEGDVREMVERFMPDLADKLPHGTNETFDQAFGQTPRRSGS